jgi:hypothetical protein
VIQTVGLALRPSATGVWLRKPARDAPSPTTP